MKFFILCTAGMAAINGMWAYFFFETMPDIGKFFFGIWCIASGAIAGAFGSGIDKAVKR